MPDALPEFLCLKEALAAFARATTTQSQEHIRPLHKHFSIRLVVEGGFFPDEVVPHPPLRSVRRGGEHLLEYDPTEETNAEQYIIGGLKSKKVDVVVLKTGIGPVMAISLKGTGNAFRNLTNRMEEAVGDCTNIHLRYPSLVYGFFHVLKAVREGQGILPSDVSVQTDGRPRSSIIRYATALEELTGRRLWRDDPSAYECAALAIIESTKTARGKILDVQFGDGRLSFARFTETLFRIYDIRFPYMAESMAVTRRIIWSRQSPFFERICGESGRALEAVLGYDARVA